MSEHTPVSASPEPPATEKRNPVFDKMESVDVTHRDEHVAQFKAWQEAQRSDPKNAWHRKGRKKKT